MVFSSHLFLFYFLPLGLAVYYALPRRARHLGLTVLSYAFYGWADPRFCLLLFATTFVDYAAALAIRGAAPWSRTPLTPLPVGGRTPFQRAALAASVVSNLAVLGFFKYFNFAADSYHHVAALLGWGDAGHTALRVALPLGISFYTFQSLSYTIDVYRGHATPTRNLIDLACFVSMFPQLVAGPIIRYSEVADQLASRTHTPEKFARGVTFLSFGLAKKVLLANPCGRIADLCFATPGLAPLDAWYGAVAYAFQIYFDFSGYSDMAIGLGLMMGFMFAKNFDSPYRATSITDFWRRWHLSLSTWLRDYLYIPLGGNRRGRARTFINIAVVMLIGGLWHGAAWTFVIWGGIHGALLITERALWRKTRTPSPGTPGEGRVRAGHGAPGTPHSPATTALKITLTFALVTLAWVFFRSPDLPSALAYLRSMFAFTPTAPAAPLIRAALYQPYTLATTLTCAAVIWLAPQTWDFTRSLPPWKIAISLIFLWLSIVILSTQAYNPFIYFIF